MLALVLHAGGDAYGLDIRQVIEVVPAIALRRVPHAPDYVAGLFSYRGHVVPVIDLCRLTSDRSCEKRLSTRIVLVAAGEESAGRPRPLGLIAERVTEFVPVPETKMHPIGLDLESAPYLGKVVSDAETMIQFLRVEEILPEQVRTLLLTSQAETGG